MVYYAILNSKTVRIDMIKRKKKGKVYRQRGSDTLKISKIMEKYENFRSVSLDVFEEFWKC
jgi:hypothetical protein